MAKIALLIGVSEYEPGLNPLPGAVKDVDAMKRVLEDQKLGGFSSVKVLKNPARQEMENAIYDLFIEREKDDLVLFYFSGHGIKDDSNNLFLATRETEKTPRGQLRTPTAVAASYVRERMMLGNCRSKRQLVILDCCYSGAFAEGNSSKDDGSVDIRSQLGGEGRAILTSSTSTQLSFEQQGEKLSDLSTYTHFLVEGIETGAADQDDDGMVSVDDLHEYVRKKVQETSAAMRPERFIEKGEGEKILLAKVPQGDPRQKYQKEVARCGKRGELTIVSRGILDTWRLKLGLSDDEAKALEDEVLEPCRREFQQKLQRYEQVVAKVLERDDSIDDNTRQELESLQQVLELRKEDTVPIEAKLVSRLKTRKLNLQTYKEAFSEALRQEYPPNEATRSRLQETQKQLELSDADVAPIEAHITTEVETYRRNLQEYEQAFVAATHQEYPLSRSRRNELRQHQQRLGFTDVEIAPIEAKVTTQIETYHQKLQQYKEAFANATQRKYQPGEATRTQLRQTWQTLDLTEIDVKAIEASILTQVETYQANLRHYEQAFADATEQHYPLSDAMCSELRQRQQALSLSDEDIAPIENRITASVEDHLKKFQQYEQVFLDSIQFEFPVSEATRLELQRFQQVLELRDEQVAQLEEKVISQNEISKNQSQQVNNLQVPENQPLQVQPLINQRQQKDRTQLEQSINKNTSTVISDPVRSLSSNKILLAGAWLSSILIAGGFFYFNLIGPQSHISVTPSPTASPSSSPSPLTSPSPQVSPANSYPDLKQLLASQSWQEANHYTFKLIRDADARHSGEGVTKEAINQFPCQSLKDIDRLWVHYSNGAFGFSIQRKILESAGHQLVGLDRQNEIKVYHILAQQVGWENSNGWKNVPDFRLDAPRGHLPRIEFTGEQRNPNNTLVPLYILLRAETCQL